MQEEYRIQSVYGREILDSRGNPTIEAEITLKSGVTGRASVPSGASTGSFEAVELRDPELPRYHGQGVKKAVDTINHVIAPLLEDVNIFNQVEIDRRMIQKDGTKNKSKLGANAILGVSLAAARTAANALHLPLYQYLGGVNAKLLPVPMMNIMNGGKHADSSLSIQEFMIMPVGAKSYHEGLEWCVNVFHTLKKLLQEGRFSTAVGDEGGFAPDLRNDEEAIIFIMRAIERAGYRPGPDFMLALDVASTEMYEEAVKTGHAHEYYFWKSKEYKTTAQMIDFLEGLCSKYPIFSIEDGLAEEDWSGWQSLTERLGNKVQLVGDDLFVTNPERIAKGIEQNAANAVLIKLNQIGTLTETLDAIEMTQKNGWNAIVSHRSGETEDTTIADIAVGLNAGQIKTGAPSRSERVAKYNTLLRIEEQLAECSKYPDLKKSCCS